MHLGTHTLLTKMGVGGAGLKEIRLEYNQEAKKYERGEKKRRRQYSWSDVVSAAQSRPKPGGESGPRVMSSDWLVLAL